MSVLLYEGQTCKSASDLMDKYCFVLCPPNHLIVVHDLCLFVCLFVCLFFFFKNRVTKHFFTQPTTFSVMSFLAHSRCILLPLIQNPSSFMLCERMLARDFFSISSIPQRLLPSTYFFISLGTSTKSFFISSSLSFLLSRKMTKS